MAIAISAKARVMRNISIDCQKHTVTPYYQPILAVEDQLIYGYEVLGRQVLNQKITSLGPFFSNPMVSTEEKLQIDRTIRQSAFFNFFNNGRADTKLFINIKPEWIFRYFQKPAQMPTLRFLDELGVAGTSIVIEITEDSFQHDISQLVEIIACYREAGCQIAIDDVGSGFVNFDRIAFLRPDILKIDLKVVKNSTKEVFIQDILSTFAIGAEKIGASLLFEGVETREEMQNALKMGARYVQGFLFSPANPHFENVDSYCQIIKEELDIFTQRSLAENLSHLHLEKQMNEILCKHYSLESHIDTCPSGCFENMVKQLIPSLPPECFRIFICDEKGNQLSPNFNRSADGDWSQEEKYQGKNWSWRPYCLKNILKAKHQRHGVLSQDYIDAHSKKRVVTFIFAIAESLVLFIDVNQSQD